MTDVLHGVAGLALPPKVTGKVYGHLVMKVDEILWARKPPGEVSAVVMWWGGEEPTTFRPTDVTQDSLKRKNTGVIYEIRTSLSCFEKYLQRCGSLEIAVADKYGMPIGCASVSKLWQMIGICPYQNYYPIVNNFGNRIGDLHVSFNLRMLPNIEHEVVITSMSPNKEGIKTKTLKRLHISRGKQPFKNSRSKEEKTKKNEKVMKDSEVTYELEQNQTEKCFKSASEKFSDADSDREEGPYACAFKEPFPEKMFMKRTSPTSNIISQILEHGTKLRNAMTASVMEDAPQLDTNHVQNLDGMSQLLSTHTCKMSSDKTDSFSVGGLSRVRALDKTSQSEMSAAVEKKVLDYLSGKPMNELEEKEALESLRSITPTKEILDSVVQDGSEVSKNLKPKDTCHMTDAKEISKMTSVNINDHSEINNSVDHSSLFDVDLLLLSQINCLRITVYNLILNSVGIKRIGSSSQRKAGPNKFGVAFHPPGVTYFVEYQFPLGAASRPWESTVRYCSKRVNDHEVMFGNRTTHNLPSTWRSSVSEQTALGALLSSLTFKVCARHLHQRVPVSLGSAAPKSTKTLLESAHLRHDFDVPVIAPDHLPVAQLRICIELGRDRIHFGGLFDPENNSLGVKSPKEGTSCSLKKDTFVPSKSVSSRKKQTTSTTVTRNIHQKSTFASRKWRDKVNSPQVAQADRVIKQLVANAAFKLQQSQPSESSSAPSTARQQISSTYSRISVGNQMSAFMPGCEPSITKPQGSDSLKRQFLKHEVALTILQVIDSNVLRSSVNQGLYVLYTFPVWSALKNESVEWLSFSTEPLACTDGIWPKSQSRIHAIVLSETESFHTFLQHVFKMQRMAKDGKVSLLFSVCIRDCALGQDLQVAEAYLPLTYLSTLEDAFLDAAKNNPNFSSSSCSSVVLDLPLQVVPSSELSRPADGIILKVKVDYRQTVVSPLTRKTTLPNSHGDSVIGSVLDCNFKNSNLGKKTDLKFKETFQCGGNYSQPVNAPMLVPSWARSPDKKYPSDSRIGSIYDSSNSLNLSSNRMKISSSQIADENFNRDMYQTTELSSRKGNNLHGSWEPAQTQRETHPFSKCTEERSPYVNIDYHAVSENHKSTSDLKIGDGDQPTGTVPLFDLYCGKNSLNLNSVQSSSQDLKLDCIEKHSDSNFVKVIDECEILSQRHTLTRGTSPLLLSKGDNPSVLIQDKSTSTQKIPNHKDIYNQVTVVNVTKQTQTTPRLSQEVLKRDVGTSADLCILQTENEEAIKVTSSHGTEVIPQCNTDYAEAVDSEQELLNIDPISVASSEVRDNDGHHKEDLTTNFSKKAVTESGETENSSTSLFLAKVGVECALHLQQAVDPSNTVFVTFNPSEIDGHISSQIGLNVSTSPAVTNNGEPEWNWHSEIQLPCDLIFSTGKRLVFKIWQNEKAVPVHSLQGHGSYNLIGFSALDLTVLAAGLPLISGWFNVMDFSGVCHGQIKLSVEPLEDISRTVKAPSLPILVDVKRNSAPSMYVAHCAYPEFPSHVTQFTDMRVEKVDPQPPKQAMSAVLRGYQLLLQHCQRSNSNNSTNSTELTSNEPDNGTYLLASEVSMHMKNENISLETFQATKQPSVSNSAAIVGKSGLMESFTTVPQQNSHMSVSESVVEVKKNPSILLREKLSELDRITKNIKARLLTKVESGYITRSTFAPYSLPFEDNIESSVGPSEMLDIEEGDSLKKHNLDENRKKQKDQEQHPSHVSEDDTEKIPSHRQRKTWERQEDLIDFGALQISCEEEDEQATQTEDKQNPSHIEDDAEWLSESALKQVFNPFLFNDILNSINPNQSVQVIELDDTENSDENNDSPATACSSSQNSRHVRSSPVVVKEKIILSADRRSRIGNETYRKEVPHLSLNDLCASLYSGRSGLSAGDADSGVDVDVSANFQSGVFSALAESQHNPHLYCNSSTSRRAASSEREESSSCSVASSRRHQSTMPSSLSASASGTPSDSPQRSRQAPEGCTNSELCQTRIVLGKRRTAPTSSHRS